MVTAQEMGKKGGSAKSEAKAAAARKNAARKPRRVWVTAIAYEVAGVHAAFAFGSVITKGKPTAAALDHHEWVCQKLREEGVGLRDEVSFDFRQLSTSSMAI